MTRTIVAAGTTKALNVIYHNYIIYFAEFSGQDCRRTRQKIILVELISY